MLTTDATSYRGQSDREMVRLGDKFSIGLFVVGGRDRNEVEESHFLVAFRHCSDERNPIDDYQNGEALDGGRLS